MAVEATSVLPNLFLIPHFLTSREIMLVNPMETIADANTNQMGCGSGSGSWIGMPLSGTSTIDSLPFPPLHYTPHLPPTLIKSESGVTTALKMITSESGLTYNTPSLERKRNRDFFDDGSCYSFLGEDISVHMQRQQFDLDRLISQHMQKVRMEIEERRKRQARRIVARVEGELGKRLRAKQEEIEKMGNLNWALEERVKSLSVENQIWMDLAQANEAAANALRSNLQQVLAQARDEPGAAGVCGHSNKGDGDDAESCCGSNSRGNEAEHGDRTPWRHCRKCWKEEASLLLLPCRHLCLCSACGSSLHTCPLCSTPKNASLHVNFS